MNFKWSARSWFRSAAGLSWRLRRGAAALWVSLALASPALEFQPGSVVTLQGFKTQGRDEKGTRWFLDGESAVVRGTVYELTGVTLKLEGDDGRTAVIRSRACTYHQNSGLVESSEAVHVLSGDVKVDGVGFDMLMSERRLRIRDAVRMETPSRKVGMKGPGVTKPEALPGQPDENAKPR